MGLIPHSINSLATNGWLITKQYGTELLSFVGAVAAYLPGLGWGLPYATGPDRVLVWATDDISPLPALTEVYQAFVQAGPNPWLGYPLLHHFILVATYAPYLAWLMLTGQFGSPSSVYPFGMQDPVGSLQALTVIARLVSCCMAAGIVLVAYRIGLTLWGKKEGIFAAIVCVSSYQMFYYSKTANLEVPYLFWASLGLLIYTQILISGISVKRAVLLGAFAALATATKDQAAGLFLLLPLIIIPIVVKAWKEKKTPLWSPILGFVITGTVVYALGSGLAVDPKRYFAHVDFVLKGNSVGLAALYTEWYPRTFLGMAQLSAKFLQTEVWVLGPLVIAFAAVAIVHTGWRNPLKLAFLIPAASYLLTMILPMGYMYLRYAMPVSFIFAVFAGRGMVLGLEQARRSRFAVCLGIILALAWPFGLSLDLALQMRTDARYKAEEWLSTHLPDKSDVGYIGSVNSLPRLRGDLQILPVPPGRQAFDYLQNKGPEFLIVVPDWTSSFGMQHSKFCPDDLYQRLLDGSLGYNLAGTFTSRHFIQRQLLDYPSVNPPVRVFNRTGSQMVRANN